MEAAGNRSENYSLDFPVGSHKDNDWARLFLGLSLLCFFLLNVHYTYTYCLKKNINTKEGQGQRMFKLPPNWTHLTH